MMESLYDIICRTVVDYDEVDYVWLSIKTQLSKLSAVSIYEKNHTLMNISSDCF